MNLLILIGVLSLAQSRQPANVTGTWEWQGAAGWQRIILMLKSEGSGLTGTVRMGPGAHEPETPAEYWEFFFDPVDFKISNGTVSGNLISFEHAAARPPSLTPTLFLRGARPAASKFVYKGVVQADEIVITRESVMNQKDPWSLGVHKVEFVLKRVK
jgi:hypothetical protein